VESSFQPEAMSKAGAAGLWQFIRSTGRRFLRIDRAVDERLDPYRATEAAAQLLAYNYRVLGTWPLAITAYNHGAAGMRRAREQLGTDDIVKIVRYYHSPSFGFASRNYYASFLAALRLDRDPEKYFGAVRRQTEVSSQEVALPATVRVDVLERMLGIATPALRELNPALRPTVWSLQQAVPRGYRLRLPAEGEVWNAALLERRLSGLPAVAVVVNNTPAPRGSTSSRHRTPLVGAVAIKPSVAAPTVTELPPTGAVAQAAPTGESPLGPGEYRVASGDSLASIAMQAGVKPDVLMRVNGLSDADRIYEGQHLTLIAPAGGTLGELARSAEAERQQEAQEIAAAASSAAPLTVAQATEQGPALVPDSSAPPSADPIDYTVRADNTVVVVATETIGHYADWLNVPTASLRALNGMRGHSTVLMGRRFKLAFAKVTREQFEQRRRDYHQQLQTAYFAAHRITGTALYVARRGDSLWSVTQKGALPVWLLQQYNPDVDFAELRPGTQIVLPQVEAAS